MVNNTKLTKPQEEVLNLLKEGWEIGGGNFGGGWMLSKAGEYKHINTNTIDALVKRKLIMRIGVGLDKSFILVGNLVDLKKEHMKLVDKHSAIMNNWELIDGEKRRLERKQIIVKKQIKFLEAGEQCK